MYTHGTCSPPALVTSSSSTSERPAACTCSQSTRQRPTRCVRARLAAVLFCKILLQSCFVKCNTGACAGWRKHVQGCAASGLCFTVAVFLYCWRTAVFKPVAWGHMSLAGCFLEAARVAWVQGGLMNVITGNMSMPRMQTSTIPDPDLLIVQEIHHFCLTQEMHQELVTMLTHSLHFFFSEWLFIHTGTPPY